MITCEQCRDEMAEFALGHCDPEAKAAMNAHLAACVVCRRELVEIESAWAALPLAYERGIPGEDLLQRVLARIDATTGAPPVATISALESPLTPRRRVYSYVLAASVLVAAAGAALIWGERRTGSATDDRVADQALHDLAQRLGKLQELEQMLNSSGVRLTSLQPRPTGDGANAYVVWDTTARQWHFFASNLKPAPAGMSYQLWAVAEGEAPLPGPTFEVDAAGMGSVIADFPDLTPGLKTSALVTLQAEPGAKAPSGRTILEVAL